MLDVVMPKLGALDAYTLIRAIRPDARVLFTTGYAPEATQLAAQLEDARVRLLPKPFTSHALGMAVREALDAYGAHVRPRTSPDQVTVPSVPEEGHDRRDCALRDRDEARERSPWHVAR